MFYDGDSFFTLSMAGRIGLICLSAVLSAAVLILASLVMRGRGQWARLIAALAAFALFVWLSPQIYYIYYRMIIPGLPAQWVIGGPPYAQMLAFATFSGPVNLSAHGQGVLFWMLALLSLRASARSARKR